MLRPFRLAVLFVGILIPAATVGGAVAQAAPASHPIAHGSLGIQGVLRDGAKVRAAGVTWTHGPLASGDRLLSFAVSYTWLRCTTRTGPCVAGAGLTATPYAAGHYVAGHADTGKYLRLIETATQVVETDPATFSFTVVRSTKSFTTRARVAGYARGRAPTSAFINGLPEARTGSNSENFTVSAPHYATADHTPTVTYRIDSHAWTPVARTHVVPTGKLAPGNHSVTVRTANAAGTTSIAYRWTVTPLPAPVSCAGSCWYPPHLDSTGHPMRWDWQIGRVVPLQRTGVHAVDFYDIDGFLTTPAEITAMHTRWQASTLAHPKVGCYLDLAWENYRPDGSPSPHGTWFPARTLGRVYYGYANERWVDFRQLSALKPLLDKRISMCAAKGFDAVELDDIESYDSPTGFHLTPGDAKNFLAYAMNDVHRHGMTVLWKNTGLISSWGRRYTDGAVVEECYTYNECFSSTQVGQSAFGITCTALSGTTPCGWDDFTTYRTSHQPNGKWVGEIEYGDDGFVCNPGRTCAGRKSYAAYCNSVYSPSDGFSAAKLDVDLDGKIFYPCPNGR